jgi:hypothetical protein
MADNAADEVIARLDDVLSTTPQQVGVAVGIDLWVECVKRELVSMEDFSVLGTGFWPHSLPAYRNRNHIFVHPLLADWDAQIGKPQ